MFRTVIHADQANAEGYTGQGVGIGIIGTGADTNNEALQGHVVGLGNFYGTGHAGTDGSDLPPTPLTGDEDTQHGTEVAQVAGGRSVERFPGGIAPDSSIYTARVMQGRLISDEAAASAARYMYQHNGVRLFNMSFGGPGNSSGSKPLIPDELDTDFRNLVRDGALFVWAAGNDGQTNPGSPGDWPLGDPALESGWLVVAASYHNPKTPGSVELASYSNACGGSQAWCLTAEGTVGVYHDGTDGADGYTSTNFGTSFATPAVTGAAADVWQAYPWMSATQVRNTLLSTADDIGEAGVDPVFGWGLLDVGKAVEGPAVLAWGTPVYTVPSGSYTFSNDLRGDGGLTKAGAGSLTLAGDALYRGTTTVENGLLRIFGSLPTSPVRIEADGLLALGGELGQNITDGAPAPYEISRLVSSGVLSLGSAVSSLNVDGDFSSIGTTQRLARIGLLAGQQIKADGKAVLENTKVSLTGVLPTFSFDGDKKSLELVIGKDGLTHENTTVDANDEDSLPFVVADYTYTPTALQVNLSRPSSQTMIHRVAPATWWKRSAIGGARTADVLLSGAGHAGELGVAGTLLANTYGQSAGKRALASLSGAVYGQTLVDSARGGLGLLGRWAAEGAVRNNAGAGNQEQPWTVSVFHDNWNEGRVGKSGQWQRDGMAFGRSWENGNRLTQWRVSLSNSQWRDLGEDNRWGQSRQQSFGLWGNLNEHRKWLFWGGGIGMVYSRGHITRPVWLGSDRQWLTGRMHSLLGLVDGHVGVRHVWSASSLSVTLFGQAAWSRSSDVSETGSIAALGISSKTFSQRSVGLRGRWKHDQSWGQWGFSGDWKTVSGPSSWMTPARVRANGAETQVASWRVPSHVGRLGVFVQKDRMGISLNRSNSPWGHGWQASIRFDF